VLYSATIYSAKIYSIETWLLPVGGETHGSVFFLLCGLFWAGIISPVGLAEEFLSVTQNLQSSK